MRETLIFYFLSTPKLTDKVILSIQYCNWNKDKRGGYRYYGEGSEWEHPIGGVTKGGGYRYYGEGSEWEHLIGGVTRVGNHSTCSIM